MVEVYRVDKVPAHGNSHAVNREEIWSVVLDRTFSTEPEARDYIITMNRKHCGYELGIQHSTSVEGIAARCLDPIWSHHQKYFLGRPDIQQMQEQLRQNVMTVLGRI
jgi:hypothetical protein